MSLKVGVLALQGAFREHREMFEALGATVVEVRTPSHLGGTDALVLPGGESTTMRKLLDTAGLLDVLCERIDAGTPVLATCAGLILLASEVSDARDVDGDPRVMSVLDCTVRRNAYGPQPASFEAPLTVVGLPGGTFPGVFIRAPVIERTGRGVEVRSLHDGNPVYVASGPVRATTFHPELADDLRLHEQFLSEVTA
ncbi:MAG: pyridoxal 5'-phosphate synthase glutaminase subunit PdxT [Acidimicrobiia bacterium]|nr:pyridoxal 5'-phosphate synthase glutaminase subunit PdxT [Acidimicrobiia bacterium]